MLIEIVNFFVTLIKTKASEISLKAKYVIGAGLALAGLILILDLICVVLGPLMFGTGRLAQAGVIVMIPAGVLLWIMVGIIWGSADLAQEILPASMKNEINTLQAMGIAGKFIALNIGLMFIPIIWEVEDKPGLYLIALGCISMLMFQVQTKPSKKK